MIEIAEFVEARLAGEEASAHEAALASGMADGTPEPDWVSVHGGVVAAGTIAVGCHGDMDPRVADHIVRWDPTRVLADIAAKRHLLEWCVEALRGVDLTHMNEDGWLRNDPHARATHTAVLALCAMAAPYAEHPDFRPEWRIDG